MDPPIIVVNSEIFHVLAGVSFCVLFCFLFFRSKRCVGNLSFHHVRNLIYLAWAIASFHDYFKWRTTWLVNRLPLLRFHEQINYVILDSFPSSSIRSSIFKVKNKTYTCSIKNYFLHNKWWGFISLIIDQNIPTAQTTSCSGFFSLGFSLGQDDEDKDEREARDDDIEIPSLKDYEREMEILNARGRRASHFYGHVTRQGDDTSEGNKKLAGVKIRPPKPRWTNRSYGERG